MNPRLLVFLTLILASGVHAQRVAQPPKLERPTAFAILVDSKTYLATKAGLEAYKEAIEKDGLGTHLIADDWKDPEAVRAQIAALYRASPPLEGVVFVGAIPIPMVRDAHHLTSSFKMNPERKTWRESSVPSDRYYDDLDLRLDRLKQDEENPLLFYYSLRADSPQRIEREIYSGRILPGASVDASRLDKWLKVAVRRKQEARPLNDVLTATGHGYNSGSLTAWESMCNGLREQIPWLYQPGGRIRHLHHSNHLDLKEILLREVQSPRINLCVFHAHGSPDTQYLSGSTPVRSATTQIDAVKRDLRNRLRRAKKRGKDLEAEKAAIQERLGVPVAWFEGAFDPDLTKKDESLEEAKDIKAHDLDGLAPAPEVVIFDECFNACFIKEPYIAGSYVFSAGGTVAGIGATVNVLQDVWCDEHLGLLGHGMRVGEWHRLDGHLETHLIGDPTFRFARGARADLAPLVKARVQELTSMLMIPQVPTALRGYALHRLARSAKPPLRLLSRLGRSDPSETIRLLALKQLAWLRAPGLAAFLMDAMEDPCEVIRRQAVRLMGELGNVEFLPKILTAVASDCSPRVGFQGGTALSRFSPADINAALDDKALGMDQKQIAFLRKRYGQRSAHLEADLVRMREASAPLKKRLSSVRTFRLYRLQDAIDPLLEVAANSENPMKLRVAAFETLGWFGLSRHRERIETRVRHIANASDTPADVRREAQKTASRLAAGPGDPFTP